MKPINHPISTCKWNATGKKANVKIYSKEGNPILSVIFLMILACTSCKKLVQINPPVSTITTSQVFLDSADATSAIAGIYSNFVYSGGTGIAFGNGSLSIFTGASADELLPFNSSGDQISTNTLISNNNVIYGYFWSEAYSYLYQVNAVIEGLQASPGVAQVVKDEIMGEAKFFRAFINFYLVNLFGDIPLLNSTDYKSNSLTARISTDQVYKQIISDLKDAQNLLPNDYSSGGGERIRANKSAATALLARVYLYTKDWPDAAVQASAIINNSSLYILDTLNGVFSKNSKEAILQWQINSTVNTRTFNATHEGYMLIPRTPSSQPYFYLTKQLLDAFEAGDQRKIKWIDSTTFRGTIYYYPYKYKTGPAQTQANAIVTEYYMVLRLAEQYLIRAEAEAESGSQQNFSQAIADLNVIRNRAGLSNYSGNVDQASILNAIYHEDQIEFFAEWGHRWFDLKRTGRAHDVLSAINYKQPWQGDYQLLYPIPLSELQRDPNLTQNPGY